MKLDKSVFQTLTLISQLGLSVIVPILVCTFLGIFLERKFSISITVPLIILGVLAGARNAYVLAKQAIPKPEDEKDEEE